jgi:Skp family chaperone for outer membrane proteins
LRSNRIAVTGVLAISLLVGVGAVMVHARQGLEGKGIEQTFGMVDMERIYEASDAPQQYALAQQQIETDAQTRVDAMASVPMLSDPELKEFGELVGLKNPDARQKVRIDELKEFSDKRAAQLREVQVKPEAQLTAEDRRLMTNAATARRQFDRMIGMMQQDMRAQISEREDAVKRGLIAKLRVEVNKVAKEKKISHVFDTTVMVSSTNDLTPAVIQRVAKKAQAPN